MLDDLTPKKIVECLDRYIVGQNEAKRAVGIALRNRSRRRALPLEQQDEIYPKNILMIGSTGVGKTEIARRLAKLVDAPFVKVEASKFTEVGYVGRDVDGIIRDLMEQSVSTLKARRREESQDKAKDKVEDRLLDLLVPPYEYDPEVERLTAEDDEDAASADRRASTRDKFCRLLREGKLEEREVEIDTSSSNAGVSIMGMPMGASGMEEMSLNLKDMMEKIVPGRKKRTRIKVSEARPILEAEEIENLIDEDATISEAKERVEQDGIVFLDELDKIIGRDSGSGPDVSREGVQRDILPLIEGSTVITKYGMVCSDHVLFIAAGAFHGTSPQDLIPELQGRFPIRTELSTLDEGDFVRILREPQNSLLQQSISLLGTEGLDISFTDEAIDSIAHVAFMMNEEMEDIGARRLQTVVEKLLEDISFEAPDLEEKKIDIDADMVKKKLDDVVTVQDMKKYIL
jgi:ATP-dependent HslUV protease ATP-binding subunit HslU